MMNIRNKDGMNRNRMKFDYGSLESRVVLSASTGVDLQFFPVENVWHETIGHRFESSQFAHTELTQTQFSEFEWFGDATPLERAEDLRTDPIHYDDFFEDAIPSGFFHETFTSEERLFSTSDEFAYMSREQTELAFWNSEFETQTYTESLLEQTFVDDGFFEFQREPDFMVMVPEFEFVDEFASRIYDPAPSEIALDDEFFVLIPLTNSVDLFSARPDNIITLEITPQVTEPVLFQFTQDSNQTAVADEPVRTKQASSSSSNFSQVEAQQTRTQSRQATQASNLDPGMGSLADRVANENAGSTENPPNRESVGQNVDQANTAGANQTTQLAGQTVLAVEINSEKATPETNLTPETQSSFQPSASYELVADAEGSTKQPISTAYSLVAPLLGSAIEDVSANMSERILTLGLGTSETGSDFSNLDVLGFTVVSESTPITSHVLNFVTGTLATTAQAEGANLTSIARLLASISGTNDNRENADSESTTLMKFGATTAVVVSTGALSGYVWVRRNKSADVATQPVGQVAETNTSHRADTTKISE